ncbi:MAG: hypothetical protein JOZ62_13570, partial [Acidobacteriaceae bacterium]|nr:hypothetical protein [Acidobacteriaceae bacterium]
IGYSWYHALQARVEKRFSHGYTLQASYTHSKYMQATEFLNPTDPVPYRMISDMDRPNLFSMSALWEIPVGQGRRYFSNAPGPLNAIIGGWQLNADEVHQSGQPLAWGSITSNCTCTTSSIIFTGNIKDIPLPAGQRSVDHWFNTAGFNTVTAQQLANNIRTFPLRFSGIRAEGQTIFNLSLIRNYHIAERLSAQFRAEVYNALNHPVFSTPNTTPTSSAFGTITSDVSEPREWQFALKFLF